MDVRLHVKEKSRLRLNTGTYIGSQEGSLVRARLHAASCEFVAALLIPRWAAALQRLLADRERDVA